MEFVDFVSENIPNHITLKSVSHKLFLRYLSISILVHCLHHLKRLLFDDVGFLLAGFVYEKLNMLPKFMERLNKMTSSMQLSSSFSSTGQDAIVNKLKQIDMFNCFG